MKRLFVGIMAGAGLILLFQYNPAQVAYFPPCPFRLLTGLPCPGCGSQRCLHQLLHGHVGDAFALHPLLVLSLPYLLLGFLVEYSSLRVRFPQIRAQFYGRTAARIWAGIVVGFWFIRLLTFH